jgi:ornithine decarboxylase
MRVLDIEGGFVAGAVFDEAAAVMHGTLADHFGDLLPRVEVVGEPGTYFAETAFTLVVRVIGKRARGEARDYWIGSLSGPRYGFVTRPRPLAALVPGEKTYASTVFGPTCDSFDMVVTGYPLPEMSVGDWLVFDDMGAYTTALASNFNGFSMSDINTCLAYSS